MKLDRITDCIQRLGGVPSAGHEVWAPIRTFYRLLGLRHSPGRGFYESNWWRGPLLYCLVRRLRPRAVLEYGTGRGYGAACMAQAVLDAGIDAAVYTIDIVPPDQPQPWAIDEGSGPAVKRLSRNEVWGRQLSDAVRGRLHALAGSTASVMRQWKARGLPRIDFAFIDAGHGYWDVRHDLLTALGVAGPGAVFLFDDYTTRPGFGVDRLLNVDVAERLPGSEVSVIDTLCQDTTPQGNEVEHLMAILKLDPSVDPAGLFTPAELAVARWVCTFRAGLARARGLVRGAVRRLRRAGSRAAA